MRFNRKQHYRRVIHFRDSHEEIRNVEPSAAHLALVCYREHEEAVIVPVAPPLDATMVPEDMQKDAEPVARNAEQADGAPAAHEHVDLDPPTPPQQPQEAEDASPIEALKKLIENLVENANEILPMLGGAHITDASCRIVDTVGPAGTVRKCTLQFITLNPGPDAEQKSSSVEITEIHEDADVADMGNNVAEEIPVGNEFVVDQPIVVAPRAKRQKKNDIQTVRMVRRSDRLATLKGGFKDKESAQAAKERLQGVNLAPEFDAVIIDESEAPPPELPLETLQAIGINHCKMPPTAVSSSVLHQFV